MFNRNPSEASISMGPVVSNHSLLLMFSALGCITDASSDSLLVLTTTFLHPGVTMCSQLTRYAPVLQATIFRLSQRYPALQSTRSVATQTQDEPSTTLAHSQLNNNHWEDALRDTVRLARDRDNLMHAILEQCLGLPDGLATEVEPGLSLEDALMEAYDEEQNVEEVIKRVI